ncbi:MAG: EAL domain-containing protein [Anaerostipes sp.]|jgi:diguanylate cyclase (GGDEF)-like protein|nr:EAL domain-containing protein [Anaerostipes sp.]
MDSKEILQKALENEEFVLYLQPKYSLEENRPSGAEVLVRWQHPELGLLGPDYFLEEFEEKEQAWELDCYVWKESCRMLEDWIQKGWDLGPLTINISDESFFHPQMISVLSQLIEEYKIDPSLIWIEIKEDVCTKNLPQAQKILEGLHRAGFIILLDNFGRGTSSIKSFKDMKFDRLKVDMNFLSSGDDTKRSEMILSAIIKMANWLGISVTAVCVENKHQKNFSEASGCDNIQGFYFNKPMTRFEYEEAYLLQVEKDLQALEVEKKNISKHDFTILVIDDSEVERSILQQYLEDKFHIHCCENAEIGLAYLRKNWDRVRLVLVDYIMSGMSGVDFLKICNDEENLRDIPKIMLTSKDDSEAQVEAFRVGAYDYLTKPLVPEIVRARILHSMEVTSQLRAWVHVGEEYRHQAKMDDATGLLNKSAFKNETIRIISKKTNNYQSLFVIDVDDFKKVNDRYGHLQGDEVLKLIATVLKTNFRATDLIGRFGGDEFVVLMAEMNQKEMVAQKAKEVMEDLSQKCKSQLNIPLSVSIGITFFKEEDSFETMFQRGDKGLYKAKNTGKGKVVIEE